MFQRLIVVSSAVKIMFYLLKDLLEVEKSLTMGNDKSLMEFWGKEGTTRQSRPNSSPGVIPTGKSPDANATVPFTTSEVHFGDNSATSSLKAMLGVNFGLALLICSRGLNNSYTCSLHFQHYWLLLPIN